jgi:hypothetical protein
MLLLAIARASGKMYPILPVKRHDLIWQLKGGAWESRLSRAEQEG